MKKAAVIYFSKHGSAKTYAEWVAEDIGADLFNGADIRMEDLKPYDVLVFGGGIYSGGIQGREFIQKGMKKAFAHKLVFVFGVGITVEDEKNREQADQINFQKRMRTIPSWYFPGAYNPSEIKGFDKKIMGVTRKMIGEGDAGEFADRLRDYIDHGCDLKDRSAIAPMTEEILRVMEDDTITVQAHIAPDERVQEDRKTDSLFKRFFGKGNKDWQKWE